MKQSKILKIESISQLGKLMGVQAQHPLVMVVDFAELDARFEGLLSANLYSILIKDCCGSELMYGRSRYDYQEESMVFVAPKQVIGVDPVQEQEQKQGKGIGLFFHPDLLSGTNLIHSIINYNFFCYEVNEALHLSSSERRDIGDCIAKIASEVSRPIDKHSKRIIVSSIELLLDYCERFYDRQFITRESLNNDIIARFEMVLRDYYVDKAVEQLGLPTVKYCAQKLNLSPNYVSDLIRKTTGLSAQEHIQSYIILRAKEQLCSSSLSISEIAYSLGFEYPQYFSRQFKKRVGQTPNEYRANQKKY